MTPPFRLALRQEGEWWNAYLADPDTMKEAMKIASIRLSIVKQNESHKQAFIELVQAILADICKLSGFSIKDWNERPAPEHERSGSA